MLTHPKKADFYTRSVTYNDYGEEVYASTLSFSTGVRLNTLSFKDVIKSTGTVDSTKFFCHTRKNTNTIAVVKGDYMRVDGVNFEVVGIDPMYSKRSEIMFLVDLIEDTVV